jgi:SNF2 family DNA or RNA helicase
MIKRLGNRCYYRYALTGQPIENRPEELFSIMEFVDSDVLGPPHQFDRTFIVRDAWGKPLRYRNLKVLHERMTEAMFRRTRNDVADQLPEVVNQVIPVPFDPQGATLYRRLATDLANDIQSIIGKGQTFDVMAHYGGESESGVKGEIMAKMLVLRMLCDNPALIEYSARLYEESNGEAGSAASVSVLEDIQKVRATPKLDVALSLIEEILEQDPKNKVVLFSFFKENLRIIKKHVDKFTTSVLFMGGMDSRQRDAAKQQFATDPRTRVFLSSDAGGYGVDLPMANYLISFDLPWSAGKIDQREARIIRLSSEFPEVTVLTLVMRGSIEERQYQMLEQKRGIGAAIIDGRHDKEGKFELSLGALHEFLRTSEV